MDKDKDIFGFSQRDIQRIQRAVRYIEDNATTLKSYRRIRGTQGGSGGTSLLKAYCKEDAGTGSSITCFLGYPELNVQVWSATTTFMVGAIATFGDKYWLSKVEDNLNNEPAEDANWTEITAYNEATTYNITTAVWCLYDSKLWRSKTTGNTGNAPEEGTYWTTKAPAYDSGTAYKVEQRVAKDGKVQRCTTAGTGAAAVFTEIEEIEVYCNISCGTQLQFASPLLYEQFMINVEYISANARYECVHPFAAVEETCAEGGLLELVNVMLAQDYTNDSTSLIDCSDGAGNGMTFPAQANSTYIIEMAIIYIAETAGTGIKLAVNGPASEVSVSGVFFGNDNQALIGDVFNSYDEGVNFFNPATNTKVNFIKGDCILQTGATAGYFTLRFASEGAGTDVTIKRGSNIKYRRTQYGDFPA